MVSAQTTESRHAVRAVSLFVALVVAKSLTLAGTDLPISPWAPVVFFWQDVLAALVFLALETVFTRRVYVRLLYGAAVVYVAINVPVSLVLGSPLTWNMVRAARGPLADSVWHHLTPSTIGSVVLVIGVGALAPRVPRWWPFTQKRVVVAASLLVVVAGIWATSRIDTRGLQRNAFGALVAASTVRVPTVAGTAPFERGIAYAGENLQHLRGSAMERNVVLIVLESTAARYLGVYGAGHDPMPALTELSRRSLIFENAYAVYPESIKGLFSTLCSRYPAFNTPAELHASAPCGSLAQKLAAAGYRTALFHSGRFGYLGMAPMIEGRGFEVLRDAGAIGGEVQSSFGVDEPSTVRRMLEWVDSLRRGERFFLMYLPVAGHHPYASHTPGPFDGEEDFDRYLNALHSGDAALGQLIRGLRARGLENETLLVVQGDHGEAFGQHPDNFAHSLFIYDENIRVPLLIAAPGLIADSIRVTRVASVIDTAPTILDLLGYPAAVEHQGRSLLAPEIRSAFFYTDYSLGWLGMREGCWKYLYEIDSGRAKLFDVCRDPDELQDLGDQSASRVREYRDRVHRWASLQQDAVRRRQ